MPVSVPVVRAGNAVTPQFVPADAVGVAVGANSYVFDTIDDYFRADVAPHIGTPLLPAPRVVPMKFAGMHYHAEIPSVEFGVARNIDVPGCMWGQIAAGGRGLYDWGALDAFIDTASAARRDVVFNFLGTPRWASARPTEEGHYGPGSDAEPADLGDLSAFASALCSRYRGRGTPILAFEVWNEPKYRGGGAASQGNYFTGTPSALAAMARATFLAVKAVDGASLILSPSPTGLENEWIAGDRSGTDHLDRFMAASDGAGGTGRDWVDVVAFHSYSHSGDNNVFALPRMVSNVRAVMARHGLADRQIWITETSAITPPLNTFVVRHQQEYISRTLLLALGCGVDRVVWYSWDDPLGFARQPEVARHWSDVVGRLAGATISVVTSLRTRRVAAVVDGKRWLV